MPSNLYFLFSTPPSSILTCLTRVNHMATPSPTLVLGTPQWSDTPIFGVHERSLTPRNLAHLPAWEQIFWTEDRKAVNINGEQLKYTYFLEEHYPQPECDNCGIVVESVNNWRSSVDKTKWLCNPCGSFPCHLLAEPRQQKICRILSKSPPRSSAASSLVEGRRSPEAFKAS